MNKILFALLLIVSFPLSIFPQRYWNMSETAEINCPAGQNNPPFGYAIANGDVNGDGYSDLIVGSYSGSYPDNVYVWFGGSPFDTLLDLTFTGEVPAYTFGHAVASGDVNNDGYDDILVGDGGVYLFLGSDPMDTIPDWVAHSGYYSVALCDLNGDGYSDVIAGDPLAYQQWPHFSGAVYIYWGSENPDTLYDEVIWGGEDSNFGWKISSGHDVNGDGVSDLAVGAPTAPGYFPRISIFYGSNGAAEFDTICDVKIYNPCGELEYGYSVPLIKDINGDGYDDLAAGAHYHNSVYIYYGGNPMDNQYDVVLSGDTLGFGMSVAGIDRANNDNFGDILVGSPHCKQVYLYRGGNPIDSIPDASALGENHQHIGWSVGYAGDLNNDGKDEMVFSNYVDDSPKIWITNYLETGVEEEKDRRHKTKDIRLLCHPNPFTTATHISLCLPSPVGKEHRAKGIELKIYDVSGRMVRCLKKIPNSQFPILNYTWDGRDESGSSVQAGIYFVKGKIGNSEVTEKVVCVK